MLKKTYSTVGVFPDYGNVGTQLNVDRTTGIPTTVMPTRRALVEKIMRIRHGLKGEVHFYCVTHLGDDMLIVVSDDHQTRYYWETKGRRYPYLTDTAVRTYEDAWRVLFESFVFDERPSTQRMQRSMALFMSEAMAHDVHGDYTTRVVGKYGVGTIALDLEINSKTPKGEISVSFRTLHGYATRNLCVRTSIIRQVRDIVMHG